MVSVALTRRKRRGRKKGWRYVIRWVDRGGRHETAGGTDYKWARALRDRIWRDVNGLGPEGRLPDEGVTWAVFVAEDLAALKGTLERSTIQQVERVLRFLGLACGPRYVDEVDVTMIERFRTWRLGNGVSSATVNKDLRHLKAAFNRAKARGYVVENPVGPVKQARLPQREIRVLTREETGKLLAVCADPVLYAFVYTALQTGGRLGELMSLEWPDVRLPAGAVYIRCKETWWTKNKRNRTVGVDREGVRILVGLNRVRPGSYVFGPDTATLRRRLQARFTRAVKDAQIDHCTPHDLRRTNITWLAEAGMAPASLQAWAGHSSLNTTMNYYVRLDAGRVLEAAAAAKRRQIEGADCQSVATDGEAGGEKRDVIP